ncbi:MAG TPA: thiamine-phosphate synthase family protein [Nitrososphaerales archaeon]|nr:thiamine-phosphate synthase family protein [Nitrososphaerales archaeon]
MQPPCEIMVSEFLPNIRGLVSHELHERGESQRRIAVLLGITQARVSYYLSAKKLRFVNEISGKFGINPVEVQNYARSLSEDIARSQTDGIFTLYSIWKNLMFSGNVCSIHQRKSGISSECSVCMDLHKSYSVGEEKSDAELEDSKLLWELREAASQIENSASFPSIMPEVSVNIAMAKTNPKSGRDIAAFPGRINRVHGRAKALLFPEFGCSRHMSNVLLIFRSRFPNVSAVMNIKHDEIIERVIAELGIPSIITKPHIIGHIVSDASERGRRKNRLVVKSAKDIDIGQEIVESQPFGSGIDDRVISRLRATIIPSTIGSSGKVFALLDPGSEGVEPMTYLFGGRATEIAQCALKISHVYMNIQLQS